MEYALGIDLGTTYSAAATARDGRLEIFQLGQHSATIPSIVVLRADGEVLTGEAAEHRALAEPTRTGREFKRRLGDPTPIILGGTPYGAEALLAHLLRGIVLRITEQLGGPPATIALCHPASYGEYKIDLLRQAVRQADIGSVMLLTEPEAAAVDYARQERVPAGTVVAVYDFGGGTFDATILRKTETGFEQLGRPEGMERLGGIDFDEAIFTRAMSLVRSSGVALDANDPSTLAALARLREECRRAKEALSSDTDATIQIFLPGIQEEMRLTRPEFEEMVRPRIRETIQALGRAARSADLGFEGLDRVLLVGGSSRIPLVAEMVREATGKPVAVDAHPKNTMALGAAYVADQGRQAAAETSGGVVAASALAAAAVAPAVVAPVVAPVVPPPAAGSPPPSAGPPEVVPGAGGRGPRGRVPVIAAVGAIALVAVLAVGALALLPGAGAASPSPSASAAASVIAVIPSASVTPAPSIAPVPTASPTPTATPTPVPTPTPTPEGLAARILGITINGSAYSVDFKTFGFKADIQGKYHVHFFWDTVPPKEAGIPFEHTNWILYDTPVPFELYKVKDRPNGAKQMCILVANHDHSVIQKTGNCWDLPG